MTAAFEATLYQGPNFLASGEGPTRLAAMAKALAKTTMGIKRLPYLDHPSPDLWRYEGQVTTIARVNEGFPSVLGRVILGTVTCRVRDSLHSQGDA